MLQFFNCQAVLNWRKILISMKKLNVKNLGMTKNLNKSRGNTIYEEI